MATQRYTVTPHPVDTILTYVKSSEIAIPEIQRPFVWDAIKVRNLLDSLYQGFPIGYIIVWRNPTVRLKDGSASAGKRILIDGQQRVTALMAALLGYEVVTNDYDKVRIRIAFHPIEEKFQVANPAIAKDTSWILDVATIFAPNASLFSIVSEYCSKNAGTNQDLIFQALEKLRKISNNHIGVIELDANLSIETVTEIFIRVNSAGASLSQADFAMSKIASNETYGGNKLRKAIDYFCHLAKSPEFHKKIQQNDPEFANSIFFSKMSWLKNEADNIYDPSYTDMLRVAFTSQFKRGRLEDLVALLSGRNFQTKQFEDTIAQSSFSTLEKGILEFVNENHFKRFIMIIRSAGFADSSLIGSQNALNFAYIIYLTLRSQNSPAPEIERAVRRWFVMSLLTSRYSGSAETSFDADIRQIDLLGYDKYASAVYSAELSDNFWNTLLPQQMNTSSVGSPYFRVFRAAQVHNRDHGFLSRDISVLDLILNKSDVHHLYPRNFLKSQGMSRTLYNQIANFAVTQSEINIQIGDKSPSVYFPELFDQTQTGTIRYGGITDLPQLQSNLESHCIPTDLLTGNIPNYGDFLEARRQLMSEKLHHYFERL